MSFPSCHCRRLPYGNGTATAMDGNGRQWDSNGIAGIYRFCCYAELGEALSQMHLGALSSESDMGVNPK